MSSVGSQVLESLEEHGERLGEDVWVDWIRRTRTCQLLFRREEDNEQNSPSSVFFFLAPPRRDLTYSHGVPFLMHWGGTREGGEKGGQLRRLVSFLLSFLRPRRKDLDSRSHT